MFKSKVFYLMISALFLTFLFLLAPNFVSAEEISKETTPLDLRTQETVDNLSTKGWKWDKETKTLTLKNANFEVKDDENNTKPCITFSKADDITVIFEGENTLKSDKNAVFHGIRGENEIADGSLTFVGSSDGVLNLSFAQFSKKGGHNVGNTINYAVNLNIKSGTINSKGGFLIDDTVNVTGGTLNIDAEGIGESDWGVAGIYALRKVNITGGNVNIKSSDVPAIQVTGKANSDSKDDGVVISGGNVSLNGGNCAIHAGATGRANITINGGNITLGGQYGLYTKQGIISVNHVDSFNADNVTSEVFKVKQDEGNEIIIGDADYSEVEEAISTASKLNRDDYKDFSAVDSAISAVVRGKNATEQDEVNAMAKAINDAINSLQLVEKISDQDKNELNEETPNPDTNDEKDDSPKTGVVDAVGCVSVIALLSLAGIVIISKRK